MRPRIVVFAALFCLGLGPAKAAPQVDCKVANTTPEMAFCAEIDLKRADSELNVVWRQVLGAIDQQDQMTPELRGKWAESLRRAQRAWVAFRDADCGEPVGYEWYQGTGMGLATLECLIGKTKTRTAELKDRYMNR
jgi:uncharacterized protein YecT (DUF1311 family)